MDSFVIRAEGLDPHVNQAIEATLLSLAENAYVMYLWRNDKTAFIGKNQNAFTECKVTEIEKDDGFIARRISGGGAVYHDKGNLNFTFLSPKSEFSIEHNFSVMTGAMKKLGFDAAVNGRNDVLIGGKKFSGNAFYNGKNSCFHHGTILIGADYAKMAAYLNVPKVKLEAKGVSSVVSRVINLSEIDSSISADKVADALIEVFSKEHSPVKEITVADLDQEELGKRIAFFSDEKWIKGDNIFYDMRAEMRLSWGTCDIRLKVNGNMIEAARIYSDSLDTQEVAKKERLLVGADIYKGKQGVDDILAALREQKNEF